MRRSRFTQEQNAFALQQEENRRLKQLVADISLDKEMFQDVIQKRL